MSTSIRNRTDGTHHRSRGPPGRHRSSGSGAQHLAVIVPTIALLACLDGFLPPVPSESVIVAVAALAVASRALARRGWLYIFTGRFVPVGRAAVNLTAGVVGYPRARFIPTVALASVLWAGYYAALGVGAGHALRDRPLLAAAIGIGCGVLGSLLAAQIVGWVQARRHTDRMRPSPPGAE